MYYWFQLASAWIFSIFVAAESRADLGAYSGLENPPKDIRSHQHRGRSRLRSNACNISEAYVTASLFVELAFDRSNCPSDDWLFALRDSYFGYVERADTINSTIENEAPQQVVESVFLDIGFNKGYNYASWMAVFNPDLGVTEARWHDAMIETKLPVSRHCGSCANCRQNKLFSSKSRVNFKSKLLGVDLNSGNINLVKSIVSKLNISTADLSNNLHVNLTHAAVSNYAGTTKSILNCGRGEESCSLGVNSTGESVSVPVLTIDGLFEDYRATGQIRPRNLGPGVRYRPLVDVLMIDTEGNDAVVLSRAGRVLSERQARLVVFEYHGTCPWPNTPLQSVISMFQGHHYVCYFPGQEMRMWRITGCYSDLYDFHRWSNIYCVYKQDPWYKLFESRRVLPSVALERLVQMGKDKIQRREEVVRIKCD